MPGRPERDCSSGENKHAKNRKRHLHTVEKCLALGFLPSCFSLREPNTDQQCKRRIRGHRVVLLRSRETKEQNYQSRPYPNKQHASMMLIQIPNASWHLPDREWKKETPWKEPNNMQREKQRQRHRVVIRGITLAYVAQKMFVHEVEPEEPPALTRTRRGDHHAAGIGEPSRDVPGRSNEKKEQRAAE